MAPLGTAAGWVSHAEGLPDGPSPGWLPWSRSSGGGKVVQEILEYQLGRDLRDRLVQPFWDKTAQHPVQMNLRSVQS